MSPLSPADLRAALARALGEILQTALADFPGLIQVLKGDGAAAAPRPEPRASTFPTS